MNPDLAAKYEAIREGFAKGLESFDRYFEALEIKEAFTQAGYPIADRCRCGTKALAAPPGVRRKLAAVVVEKRQGARRLIFTASHQRVDRDSELILVDGIGLDQELPLPLNGYHERNFVVGSVTRLWRESLDGAPALRGEAEMIPRGTSSRIDELHAALDVGGLSVSIGFMPGELGPPMLPGQKGPTFRTSTLYEVSLVSVAACPTCRVSES